MDYELRDFIVNTRNVAYYFEQHCIYNKSTISENIENLLISAGNYPKNKFT